MMTIQVHRNNDHTQKITKIVTLEGTQRVVSHVCKCGYKEIVDITDWVPVSELENRGYVPFGGNKECPLCGEVACTSSVMWKSKTKIWDNYYPVHSAEKSILVKDAIEKSIGKKVEENGLSHLDEIVNALSEITPYFQAVIPPRMANRPGRSASSIVCQIVSNKEAEKGKQMQSNMLYFTKNDSPSAQAQVSKEVIILKFENYGIGAKGRTLKLNNIPEFVGEDVFCSVDLFMEGDIPVIFCLMEDIVSKNKLLKKLGLLALALQSFETSNQGYLLCVESPGYYQESEFCAIKVEKEEVSEWLIDRIKNIKQTTERLEKGVIGGD